MSIKQIFEGWRNHLLPSQYLEEKITQVSDERLAICRQCPFNSNNAKADGTYHSLRRDEHCIDCGCPLITKTKCLTCECPQHKWGPELTPEQEKIINDETNI